MSGEAARAGNLDGAVPGHLDGITPLARLVGEDRDHGALAVIAVGLVDLVADFKSRSCCNIHGASSEWKARRLVWLNYGVVVYDVAEDAIVVTVARMERSAEAADVV
jgi:hypothetical protein